MYNTATVVAVVQDDRCPGSGRNAWRVKGIESGDTICTAPEVLLYDPAKFTPWYTTQEVFDSACPYRYESSGQRKSTNAVRLTQKSLPAKAASNMEPTRPYSGWIEVARGPDNLPIYSELNAKEMDICSPSPIGYVTVEDSHPGGCQVYPSGTEYSNKTAKVPEDGDLEINVPIYAENFLVTHSWTKMGIITYTDKTHTYTTQRVVGDLHYPSADVEFTCNQLGRGIPIGYQITAAVQSDKCPTGSSSERYNAFWLNRISDSLEEYCTPSGPEKLPSNYVLLGRGYSDSCKAYNMTGQTSRIRKLAGTTDIICATDSVSKNYGVVGAAHSDACSGTGQNAWQIKKLVNGDAVCQRGQYDRFFQSSLEFVAVSETRLANCTGAGNNAWVVRAPKAPSDVICAVGSPYLPGYKATPLSATQAPQCASGQGYRIDLI